ncbi:hypothetical protein [Cohnella herbarum]
MSSAKKPTIISISSVSGGGKTTITNLLKEKLVSATALYFDDYDFEESPNDICDWVDRGANYNEWNLSPFTRDVISLLENKDLKYVLLDYPFSYLNISMREYLDFTIYVDTPLDIAMARRLIRDFKDNPNDIQNDLEQYLIKARTAYLEMVRSVKPDSDFVIDGTLTTLEIVERIKGQLIMKNL